MAKVTHHFKVLPQFRGATTSSGLKSRGSSQSTTTTSLTGVYGTTNTKLRDTTGQLTNNRINRYQLYDNMDNNVDVNKGFNVITDEILPLTVDNLPLIVNFNAPDGEEPNKSLVSTINTMLPLWYRHRKFQSRLWHIIRRTLKYGDCLYLRVMNDEDNTESLRYISMYDVLGARVDRETNAVKAFNISHHSTALTPKHRKELQSTNKDKIEIPIEELLHFTLCDETEKCAPFGNSAFKHIYVPFTHLNLIEKAIIIYRLVRAPERRVYYIDIGKNNPRKAKRILKETQLTMRQQRTPVGSNDQKNMDSVYDPESMIEDIFIPQPTDGRGSKVDVLPGGQNLGNLDDLLFFQRQILRGLDIPAAYMYHDPTTGSREITDGRVGTAYQSELQFSHSIMRRQQKLISPLDMDFKHYLTLEGVKFNTDDFHLAFETSQNFAKHKEQELQADLLTTFHSAKEIPYLSPRYALRNHLGWSDEQIKENEELRIEELGITGPKEIKLLNDMGEPTGEVKVMGILEQIYGSDGNN